MSPRGLNLKKPYFSLGQNHRVRPSTSVPAGESWAETNYEHNGNPRIRFREPDIYTNPKAHYYYIIILLYHYCYIIILLLKYYYITHTNTKADGRLPPRQPQHAHTNYYYHYHSDYHYRRLIGHRRFWSSGWPELDLVEFLISA